MRQGSLATHWRAIAALLYFLGWTATSLRMGFSYDDVTNLYVAWTSPLSRLFVQTVTFWRPHLRPVGGLVYRAIYSLAGFNPLPFHAVCLVLLLINLGLQYRLYMVLPGPAGLAWLAVAFGCFQALLWDIYVNVGTIYDILCGTFYYAALLVHVTGRRSGAFGRLHAITVAALTVLALGSKEMALSLPAVLFLYEIVFHPVERNQNAFQWARRNLLRIGPSALVCILFIAGRLLFKGPLTGHPGYTPVFAAGWWLETATHYTRLLFGNIAPFNSVSALVFWLACFGLVLWTRSRLMVFGLLSFAIGMLPMLVITPRGSYVFYVPMFGLALLAASAFIALRDRLSALSAVPSVRKRIAAGLTAAFLCMAFAADFHQGAPLIRRKIGPGGSVAITLTADKLPRICPRFAPNSRVLLIDSPFGNEKYVPLFTLGLLYNSKTLQVVNARAPVTPDALAGHFDHTFLYRGRDIVAVAQESPVPTAAPVLTFEGRGAPNPKRSREQRTPPQGKSP